MSVLPGTATSSSILMLSSLWNQCKLQKRECHLFLEDKSAAYDTVAFSLIRLAFERLHFPIGLIEFYEKLLVSRKLHTITAFGITESLSPSRGIPQGGSESPLVFIIVYDIILSFLAKSNPGFEIILKRPSNFVPLDSYPKYVANCVIKHTSYVDDLCIVAPSRAVLQSLVNILNSFNSLVQFRSNPSKSHYVVFNGSGNDFLNIGDLRLNCVSKTERIRLLGCFFS